MKPDFQTWFETNNPEGALPATAMHLRVQMERAYTAGSDVQRTLSNMAGDVNAFYYGTVEEVVNVCLAVEVCTQREASVAQLGFNSEAHFLIADLVSRVKRTGPKGLALQITSSLKENELTHDFRIIEI